VAASSPAPSRRGRAEEARRLVLRTCSQCLATATSQTRLIQDMPACKTETPRLGGWGRDRSGHGNNRNGEVVQRGEGLRIHRAEDGSDVFVHYSAIDMQGYRDLEEGQRVEFDVGPGKKGEEAQNVHMV
jgi:cold shock CspA family protein